MSSVLSPRVFTVFFLTLFSFQFSQAQFSETPSLELAQNTPAEERKLPQNVIFVGKDKFYNLIKSGIAEKWAQLPLGERTGQIGRALVGTPYKNFTLELDDYIETPCVNMLGMDCWTFFETALGIARAFHKNPNPTPDDLLQMIELDRYHGGKCTGKFTSRLHQLEDWLYDNKKRGLVEEITPTLAGNERIYRNLRDMAVYWKSSRQLQANHRLIPIIAENEEAISKRGICYLPKKYVPAAEAQLKTGDVICIVSKHPDDYTTHVGLAYRDPKGVLRFLHASKNYRRVTLDRRLSDYLNHFKSDAGIMVARPLEVPQGTPSVFQPTPSVSQPRPSSAPSATAPKKPIKPNPTPNLIFIPSKPSSTVPPTSTSTKSPSKPSSTAASSPTFTPSPSKPSSTAAPSPTSTKSPSKPTPPPTPNLIFIPSNSGSTRALNSPKPNSTPVPPPTPNNPDLHLL